MRVIILILLFYPILLLAQNRGICTLLDTSNCYITKHYVSRNLGISKQYEFEDYIRDPSSPCVFDINGDCYPELIVPSFWERKIYVFDYRKRDTLLTINTPFLNFSSFPFVVADINMDGTSEIVMAVFPFFNNFPYSGKLVCYNFKGEVIWISNEIWGGNFSDDLNGSPSLADFNTDGVPEIYINNKIFNAQTGILLADGGGFGIGLSNPTIGFDLSNTLALNFDNNYNDLELAAGFTIYKVILNNLNGIGGNSITPINIKVNNIYIDGLTTSGDINEDGIMDVVVASYGNNNNSTIYAYCVKNGLLELLASNQMPTGDTYENVGNVSIYKLRKSGNPLMLVSRPNFLHCFIYDGSLRLKLLWSIVTKDDSGSILATSFDLNGDGIKEIIYRDEEALKVVDASSGTPVELFRLPCFSGTYNEVPIIADIDNSGEAKICITCASSKDSTAFSRLTIFGPPPGQHWAPARKIWHQYAYNPLFINDDGTVPQYMHNPATYKNGKYNNFMVQESLLDEDGNYPVAAASLTGQVTCIDYDVTTQQYTATFSVNNRSEASAIALSGLPISFYNGHPESGGALIGTYRTGADITAGATLSPLTYTFSANDLTSLYMVVNTDKSSIVLSDTSYYDIDECDYTDNVFIAPAPKIQSASQEICQGDSYDFYGNVLTASGQYAHEISNAQACDSIVAIINLAVTNTKMSQQNITTCERLDWNGSTYTQSGQYTYQTTSINGCDSIVTLDLTIHPKQNTSLAQSACDTYTYQSTTYDKSGQYTFQAQTIYGCDSIITLDLTIHPTYDIKSTIAACESYTWQGTAYDQSGIYTFSTKTAAGCDSILTLDLTVSPILETSQNQAECERYTWNGSTYTQSGQYTYQTTSINGCDSIVTLDLTIHPKQNISLAQSACDTYSWQGTTYDQSGQYDYKTQTIYGCDSIITLDLTIHPTYDIKSAIAACDTYTWQGTTYDQSGIYTFSTKTSAGCDSILTLDLTVSKVLETSQNQAECEQYTWNGSTYTQSGQYTYRTTSINGCDSIVILDLTIHPKQNTLLSQKACATYTYQSTTYDKSGQYIFQAQTIYGCDSIITLDLTIHPTYDIKSTIAACETYTWQGTTYDQSGIYTFSTKTAVGCDSILTLDLTISYKTSSNDEHEACTVYVWNGQEYTSSGTYSYLTKNKAGCDSLATLTLDIYPSFHRGDTIISDQDYTWPIDGKTYTHSGQYIASFSTEAGCDSIYTLLLRIAKETNLWFPTIFNPTGTQNNVFYGSSNRAGLILIHFRIYDRWGSLVFDRSRARLNEPSDGWDGRFQNQYCVSGVYVWVAELVHDDGSSETRNGDVTIVR